MRKLAMRLGVAALGLGALAITGGPVAAEPIKACVGGDGNIKITSTGNCSRNETMLTFSTGSTGSGALQVHDANGKVVGPFSGANTVTINPTGTQFIALPMVPIVVDGGPGFSEFQQSNVLFVYTTSDCSGTRYVNNANGAMVLGDNLYYPELPLQQMSYRSLQMQNQNGTGSGCMPMGGTGAFGVAATIDIPSLGFQPPFTVR